MNGEIRIKKERYETRFVILGMVVDDGEEKITETSG